MAYKDLNIAKTIWYYSSYLVNYNNQFLYLIWNDYKIQFFL